MFRMAAQPGSFVTLRFTSAVWQRYICYAVSEALQCVCGGGGEGCRFVCVCVCRSVLLAGIIDYWKTRFTEHWSKHMGEQNTAETWT